MTTMTLRHTGRRVWTLTDPGGAPRGVLRAGRGLICADLTTPGGGWTARAHGRHRRRVTAGPPGRTVLELDPPLARLPHRETPAAWETSHGPLRYRGTLSHRAGRLTVRAAALHGGVEVEVTGEHPDLAVLAVCFALLTRRHRDRMRALSVAVVTSHGPT